MLTATIAPDPLHWFSRQSFGVCDAITVPAGWLFTPHVFEAQVRVWQAVSEPGHCAAVLHWTHTPAAEQKLPPFCEHAVSAGLFGCEGTPAEQASFVH